MIWNGPSITPKSGMITWNAGISPAKKIARARSSVAASRKTPDPLIAALRTPAPASSSRHRPALSSVVTSTVSALKLIRVARRPATVSNAPDPDMSSLISRSLPLCAAISSSSRKWLSVLVDHRAEAQADPPLLRRRPALRAGAQEAQRARRRPPSIASGASTRQSQTAAAIRLAAVEPVAARMHRHA